MTKYTCAFQWLKDNEDVVDVELDHSEYKVTCRGVYVGKMGRLSGDIHVDEGFFSASSTSLNRVQAFIERACLAYRQVQHRNKGREVLLKINELENTEDRE